MIFQHGMVKERSLKNYTELYFHIGTNDKNEMKADWISHVLHRDCLLKRVTEGKIGGMGR